MNTQSLFTLSTPLSVKPTITSSNTNSMRASAAVATPRISNQKVVMNMKQPHFNPLNQNMIKNASLGIQSNSQKDQNVVSVNKYNMFDKSGGSSGNQRPFGRGGNGGSGDDSHVPKSNINMLAMSAEQSKVRSSMLQNMTKQQIQSESLINRRGLMTALASAATVFGMGGMKPAFAAQYPINGDESIMSQKAHGTSQQAAMKNLKWNVDYKTADRITNYNRNWAEFAGYFNSKEVTWVSEMLQNGDKEYTFYDTVTGKPLFVAPRGRTMNQFLAESNQHGWPSFRDQEVVWDNVRTMKNGEAVSLTGTHLGHNLPDRTGNRYCINLVSIAGQKV